MREYLTVGKVRLELFEKINELKATCEKVASYEHIGQLKERARIMGILASKIQNNETESNELRLSIILELMGDLS